MLFKVSAINFGTELPNPNLTLCRVVNNCFRFVNVVVVGVLEDPKLVKKSATKYFIFKYFSAR